MVGDKINYAVGLRLHKKVGDTVIAGEKLVTIYNSNCEDISDIKKIILNSVEIGEKNNSLTVDPEND